MLLGGDQGAVLELGWGEFHALRPICQDPDSLKGLLADKRLTYTDVLLLADYGCAALKAPEWIAKLSPQAVLLGVEPDDKQAQPDPQVLDMAGDYNLLRTDRDGWVEITKDGERMLDGGGEAVRVAG